MGTAFRPGSALLAVFIRPRIAKALASINRNHSALQWLVKPPTMASANFCPPIPPSHDGGSQGQVDRSPRVMRATLFGASLHLTPAGLALKFAPGEFVTLMPAAYTSAASVQVPGFEDMRLLTHGDRLVCDFCSSGQCFAFGFLQIPPRDGRPCRSANRSPCRAGRGLSPPSHPVTTTVTGIAPVKALRAMPGTSKKMAPFGAIKQVYVSFMFLFAHAAGYDQLTGIFRI